jgi:signal peptidase I
MTPTPARGLPARARHIVREYLRPLAVVAVVMLAARSSLADWNDVPTASMNPTILEGDRVFVNKLAYGLKVPFTTWHLARWATPARGEVVVFFAPHDGTRMVKRVAGVPGDTVELRDEVLVVNGRPVKYGPPDLAALRDPSPARRAGHAFATETPAGGSPHPLMLTPGSPARRTFGPVVVPPGKYLMLGDNRDNSLDSRYWGLVDEADVVGRATGVVLSFDPERTLSVRWGRSFAPLP